MNQTQQPKFIITCQQPGCENEVVGVKLCKRTCFDCKRKRQRALALSAKRDAKPQ